MNTQTLDAALRAQFPIDGVSIGNIDDRSTWRIDFATGATADQQRDAQAAMMAFVDTSDQPLVPASVTNFQARAVMRQFKMADGRSLFTTVDTDLRAAVEATKALDEFDPKRVQADLQWQAWEQANTYDRQGAITQLLAGRYDFDEATTDELFRQAERVTA